MTKLQEQIDASIALLYDYADAYDTSVQIIQKLAQLLRLETFVDKHAHSVNSSINNLPYQRLTIAGSLILLDVDFLEDNQILRVSLSLANHTSDESDGETLGEYGGVRVSGTSSSSGSNSIISQNIGSNFGGYTKNGSGLDAANEKEIEKQMLQKTCTIESVLVGNESQMINIANVNFPKNDVSFLNNSLDAILFKNLLLTKLGYFPKNLKHLSRMDTLSHGNVDLFLYFDNIVLIFYLIYAIELQELHKTDPGNRQLLLFKKGFINSIGRAYLNSADELGIFVDFWRDFRFINYEIDVLADIKIPFQGHLYTYFLEVRECANGPSIDYLANLKDEIWKLLNQTYQFSYDGDSYLTNANNGNATVSIPSNGRNGNWSLWIALNHPVPVPAYLLEYLGFEDYEVEKDQKTNESGENEGALVLEGKYTHSDGYKFEFVSNLPDSSVPLVKALRLNALQDLNVLVPILRNTLVLHNVLDNFKKHLTRDSVSESGLGSGSEANGNEFSPEYKAKLKQSLKLSTHVTDEELMALNVLSGKKQETLALDSFMRYYDENDTATGNNDPLAMDVDGEGEEDVEVNGVDPTTSTVYLLVDDIGLDGANDISLVVYGDGIEKEISFKISNGEIEPAVSDSDDMVVEKNAKFIATLKLTENLHKALAQLR